MNQRVEQLVPQGAYRPAVRHGDLIFTPGMTPRRGDRCGVATGRRAGGDHDRGKRGAVVSIRIAPGRR